MRKLKYITLLLSLTLLFSCKSTEVENTDVEKTEAPVQFEDDAIVEDVQDEPELLIDEPEIILDEEEPEDDLDEEEYLRSTNALTEEVVTKQEWSEDKAEILRIIKKLSDIMETQDVQGWLSYLDPESIKYYSTPANVRKAQKKLPDKTIQLNGIGDYFKYVFIPSRKRSEVDEIRYISKTNIKAVKVKNDNSINVYYYFVKIDGKWLVHIPTL